MEQINSMHVFISYVREDSDRVSSIVGFLESQGVKVWQDKKDISPGQRWRSKIREAIRNGAYFIACFSSNSLRRSVSYMNEELTLAIEELRQRPGDRVWFIPVLLTNCEVPDRPIGAGESLRDLQRVDLFKDWGEGIRRIVSVIRPSVDLLAETDASVARLSLHHAIRYLQSHVYYKMPKHNPTFVRIYEAISYLGYMTNESANDKQTVRLKASAMAPLLEQATQALMHLLELARAAREAIAFRSVDRRQGSRYITPKDEPGLAHDISELQITLATIWRSRVVSRPQLEKLQILSGKIYEDFYADNSLLRQTLLSDITEVRPSLQYAMDRADDEFHWRYGQRPWRKHRHAAAILESEHVLINRFLYEETLYNLFTNTRHGFLKTEVDIAKLVDFRVSKSAASSSGAPVIEHNIFSYGRELPGPIESNTTLESHRKAIEDYGGELTIGNIQTEDGTRGVVARLRLLGENL